MAKSRFRQANLPEACVEQALAIIATDGVEGLSLREVARRLGVSHQAPYKHYPSREHLLAEVVARAFAAFAAHLDARPRRRDPYDDLREMGRAYIGYALAHPLHYRLMFGTPLPEPEAHPAMMRQASHAFALLTDAIVRLGRDDPPAPELDALYVWATMHGLAILSIMKAPALAGARLPAGTMDKAVPHIIGRVRNALLSPAEPGQQDAGARPPARRQKTQAAAAKRSPTTR
ncbi:MAG: TetR/AcrR family transcriptional regulator [Bauldia sp.]